MCEYASCLASSATTTESQAVLGTWLTLVMSLSWLFVMCMTQHRFVVVQSGEHGNEEHNKDLKTEVKVSQQKDDVEADLEVGMDGDVASIQTKPKEAEQTLPASMQAEQMSPTKPNPKDRLAGGSGSQQHCSKAIAFSRGASGPHDRHVMQQANCRPHRICWCRAYGCYDRCHIAAESVWSNLSSVFLHCHSTAVHVAACPAMLSSELTAKYFWKWKAGECCAHNGVCGVARG